MARTEIPLPQLRRLGETSRTDAWWLQPTAVLLGLLTFVIYTTWAGFQGRNYFFDGGGAHYLSPFYSPLLYGQPNEPRLFAAAQPSWWPGWMPFSAAFLILMGPGGFRFTCYYYRGAYYKAFWGDPPACAVGEPSFRGTRYRGERWLPLVLHNAHRYFFYVACAFVALLTYDAIRAFIFKADDGTNHFGIGVGSIVLLCNALFLGCYTFGCHCSRHFSGGKLDEISKSPARHACYTCVSALNQRHMLWAWISLVWVGCTDGYVRLLCSGVIQDFRIL
ncbi:MAG: hypothetical protein U0574_04745 [Phycisphaerales bacterium]